MFPVCWKVVFRDKVVGQLAFAVLVDNIRFAILPCVLDHFVFLPADKLQDFVAKKARPINPESEIREQFS